MFESCFLTVDSAGTRSLSRAVLFLFCTTLVAACDPMYYQYQLVGYQVAVRVRPPALKEEHANELTVVRLVNSSSLQTVDAHGKASTWEADLVIDDSEKQGTQRGCYRHIPGRHF